MISTKNFYQELLNNNIDFFTGVPDSLLKDVCAFISDNTIPDRNIIAANEGGAIGLAVGYYLATNKIPLVYLQNSGLGNTINPLLSLADKEVYSIPMVLMIGWRGEPDVKDEPQHIKQGRVTLALLDSMEIPYFVIDENSDYRSILQDAVKNTLENLHPVALVVRKNSFEPYKLKSNRIDKAELSREEALHHVLRVIPENSVIVSTTGMLSRELFEFREINQQGHNCDFLTVGSMGHASQIALGIAISTPNRKVFCFDGDGAALMHLGSMGIIGSRKPKNFTHIVFNNAAHDSVGGQPTICNEIDLVKIASACNYQTAVSISTPTEIVNCFDEIINNDLLSFIEVLVKTGSRKDLGRPITTPIQNKIAFINEIR